MNNTKAGYRGIVLGLMLVVFLTAGGCVFFDDISNGQEEEKPFAGGTGAEDDPYQIATAGELKAVDAYLHAHFILMDNIDLAPFSDDEGWLPLGREDGFSGSLYGNGFSIINLTITRPEEEGVGLFAFLAESGVLKGLCLEQVSVQGHSDVGALVGKSSGTILSCEATGTVVGMSRNTGGLVGNNRFGHIEDCWAHVKVSGTGQDFGGLVGTDFNGEIINCHATGDVEGDINKLGGLVGHLYNSTLTKSSATGNVQGHGSSEGGLVGQNSFGAILECFATGDVESSKWNTGGLVGQNVGLIERSFATGTVLAGTTYAGGLVGLNSGSDAIVTDSYAHGDVLGHGERVGGLIGHVNYGTVKRSYSIGKVEGSGHIGGLIGSMVHGEAEIIDSYYDRETSGRGDIMGKGMPRTTQEMMEKATFLPEWDFTDIWAIDEGLSYPYLQWED